MSDARDIFEEVAEQQGWDDSTMLELALRYIENQDSTEAWADFLYDIRDQENGEPEPLA